ncbi:hypothetical protein CI15_10025 [Paraburkholderia monticola]|uniref:Uncharacterized protein n=1 Tax=Paraburkholderia monticola TaxID=1399968 RepID=A0A149PWA5_9BURK|nr:hypothetical protein CI15_10025 [Paraburkholderia monticola]
MRLAAQRWRAVRRARLAAPAELAPTGGLRFDTREPRATQAPCASRSRGANALLRDVSSQADALRRRADVTATSHATPSPA